MGIVYSATHLQLDREVALKVITPGFAADPAFRERFKRESRAAASLNHPHIVTIHDAGEEDGMLYLAMELIKGGDLHQIIRAGPGIDPGEAAILLEPIADALDAAHDLGLVHRDVKPGNILISHNGLDAVPYLSDFGLTRHMTSAQGVTRTGQWIGSLDYIAPEQVKGESVDRRADVYALACVYFEAMSGAAPFPTESDIAKMWAQVHEPPPRLDHLTPAVSSRAADVLEKAMSKEPDDRPPSAGELARLIGMAVAVAGSTRVIGQETIESRIPTEPAQAMPTGRDEGPTDGRRKSLGRKGGRLVVGIVVLLLAAAGGFLIQRQAGGTSDVGPGVVSTENLSVRYEPPWDSTAGGEFIPGFRLLGTKIRLDDKGGLIRGGRVANPIPGLDPLPVGMDSRWVKPPKRDTVTIGRVVWFRYFGEVNLGSLKRALTVLMVPTTAGYQGIACQTVRGTPGGTSDCAPVLDSATITKAAALPIGPDPELAKLLGSVQTRLKEAESDNGPALQDGDDGEQANASRIIAEVYGRQAARLGRAVTGSTSPGVSAAVKSLAGATRSIGSVFDDLATAAAAGDSEGWKSTTARLGAASERFGAALDGMVPLGYVFDQ